MYKLEALIFGSSRRNQSTTAPSHRAGTWACNRRSTICQYNREPGSRGIYGMVPQLLNGALTAPLQKTTQQYACSISSRRHPSLRKMPFIQPIHCTNRFGIYTTPDLA
ncbi:MAG TPA: hypothetical protein DEF45_05595 [Rhodopirellula sp.]|nr:hypothetical protein [Rhodopirellula sp.]